MKIILTLIFLSLVIFSKAQDTTLPRGKGNIYLHSGKTVKNIRLWRIDTAKIEFIQAGNLVDLKISEVEKIEAGECLITFNNEHQMMIRLYDTIILDTGDTLYGTITKVSDWQVSYVLAGHNKNKNLMRTPVKSYIKRDNRTPIIFEK